MPKVTLYLDSETYRIMKQFKEVNWSRLFRECVKRYALSRQESTPVTY